MYDYKPEGWLIDTFENRAALKSQASLHEACLSSRVLEARVILCDSAHNLTVDLGCMRGVIPRDEGAWGLSDGTTRDIAVISRVNKPVCFIVTGFEKDEAGSTYALLSRRAVQQRCMEEYLPTLVPGTIIDARVTHLEPFGCFVDIACGISSLIPIDAISVSRISHPKDRFRVSQDIKAVVRSVDENGRITLSHKELLGTWEENAALFENGQTVAGIIRSVEDYGVFVELTPNLAGLAEPRDDVAAGQHASVYIKSLIPEKMKVKLIIVDAFDAKYSPEKPRYFIEEGTISRWRYSPENASKLVESVF